MNQPSLRENTPAQQGAKRFLEFPKLLTMAGLKAVIDPRHTITDAVVFVSGFTANEVIRRKPATLVTGG